MGVEVALRLPVPVEELGDDHDPLKPGLGDEERRRRSRFREATGEKVFRLREGAGTVTGVPVVTEGLADAVQENLDPQLLVAALVLMAATPALVPALACACRRSGWRSPRRR